MPDILLLIFAALVPFAGLIETDGYSVFHAQVVDGAEQAAIVVSFLPDSETMSARNSMAEEVVNSFMSNVVDSRKVVVRDSIDQLGRKNFVVDADVMVNSFIPLSKMVYNSNVEKVPGSGHAVSLDGDADIAIAIDTSSNSYGWRYGLGEVKTALLDFVKKTFSGNSKSTISIIPYNSKVYIDGYGCTSELAFPKPSSGGYIYPYSFYSPNDWYNAGNPKLPWNEIVNANNPDFTQRMERYITNNNPDKNISASKIRAMRNSSSDFKRLGMNGATPSGSIFDFASSNIDAAQVVDRTIDVLDNPDPKARTEWGFNVMANWSPYAFGFGGNLSAFNPCVGSSGNNLIPETLYVDSSGHQKLDDAINNIERTQSEAFPIEGVLRGAQVLLNTNKNKKKILIVLTTGRGMVRGDNDTVMLVNNGICEKIMNKISSYYGTEVGFYMVNLAYGNTSLSDCVSQQISHSSVIDLNGLSSISLSASRLLP